MLFISINISIFTLYLHDPWTWILGFLQMRTYCSSDWFWFSPFSFKCGPVQILVTDITDSLLYEADQMRHCSIFICRSSSCLWEIDISQAGVEGQRRRQNLAFQGLNLNYVKLSKQTTILPLLWWTTPLFSYTWLYPCVLQRGESKMAPYMSSVSCYLISILKTGIMSWSSLCLISCCASSWHSCF